MVDLKTELTALPASPLQLLKLLYMKGDFSFSWPLGLSVGSGLARESNEDEEPDEEKLSTEEREGDPDDSRNPPAANVFFSSSRIFLTK